MSPNDKEEGSMVPRTPTSCCSSSYRLDKPAEVEVVAEEQEGYRRNPDGNEAEGRVACEGDCEGVRRDWLLTELLVLSLRPFLELVCSDSSIGRPR